MEEHPPLERTAAVRVIGATGHVVGLLVLLALLWAASVVAADLAEPDATWSGLGTGLAFWVVFGLLGTTAALLTFRPALQHLVFCGAATFAVVGLPLGNNVMALLVVVLVVWPWSYLLRRVHPSPHWTRGDWWARALTFAIVPALVFATAAWGGRLSAGDESFEVTSATVLASRVAAVLESLVVLGPAWAAAALAVRAPRQWQHGLLAVAAVAVVVALVVLRSSLHPYAPSGL